jgi:hypothetical protein
LWLFASRVYCIDWGARPGGSRSKDAAAHVLKQAKLAHLTVTRQSDTEWAVVTWNMPEAGHIRQHGSQLLSGPPIGFNNVMHSYQILYALGIASYGAVTVVISTTWGLCKLPGLCRQSVHLQPSVAQIISR